MGSSGPLCGTATRRRKCEEEAVKGKSFRGTPEADVVAIIARPEPVTARHAHVAWIVIPSTSADHPPYVSVGAVWVGLRAQRVLSLVLAVVATLSRAMVRIPLLIALLVLATWRFHHSKLARRRSSKSGQALATGVVAAMGLFFLGRASDSHPDATPAVAMLAPHAARSQSAHWRTTP